MADLDAVVDLDRERLFLEVRERAESERWAAAAADSDFRREMVEISRDLHFAESRPE